MKNNLHPVERFLRVGIGLFLMSLAFWGPMNLWFLLGIVPVLTGLSGWCALYSAMGLSTCKVNPSPSTHFKP